MKHFQIGDKVQVIPNQEKQWTYDYLDQTLYVVGINLNSSADQYKKFVDEYNVEYTLADEFPCNKYYKRTKGFYHGDLSLVT